jgi:hypothetical protein
LAGDSGQPDGYGGESEKPITIVVQPIMARGGRGQTDTAPLLEGRHRLHLLLDPTSTHAKQRVFDVAIQLQLIAKSASAASASPQN